jgi:hypothetical protein
MKFLDQVKIYVKLVTVVMVRQVSEERNMLSMEVQMEAMVEKVDP